MFGSFAWNGIDKKKHVRDASSSGIQSDNKCFYFFLLFDFFFFIQFHPSPNRRSDRVYVYEVRTSALRTWFDKDRKIFDLSFAWKKKYRKQLSCQIYLAASCCVNYCKIYYCSRFIILWKILYPCIEYVPRGTINNVHYFFKSRWKKISPPMKYIEYIFPQNM